MLPLCAENTCERINPVVCVSERRFQSAIYKIFIAALLILVHGELFMTEEEPEPFAGLGGGLRGHGNRIQGR